MSAIDRAVLEKLKALLSSRVRLHQAFLFGSRARGDADSYSDMDVLIVLDSPVDEQARKAVGDCAWEAGFEHGIVVVPVVFSREEWENGPERHSLLAQAVENEGVPL